MEIMRFARLQRTVETIVGVHPGGVRSGRAAIATGDCNSRRNGVALFVGDFDRQRRTRDLVAPLSRHDRRLGAADSVVNDQARIPMHIADEGDAPAVRRPTGVPAVELAEADR
jgi:hypothetical protein